MKIPAWVLSVAEASINRYLHLDAETPARLARLAGKVIAVELRDFHACIYIGVDTQGLRFTDEHAGVVDVRLRGNALALARLGLSNNNETLFSGAVEVEGDQQVALQWQEMWRSVDIDWEGLLAQLTGDVVAHQAGTAVRRLFRYGTKTTQNLTRDIAEYWQEERPELPAPAQMEAFLAGVDTLCADVERLEARVRRLQSTRA